MKYVDSPFLWSGKKTNLLPQIQGLFPQHKVFVDVFGGSG
jgi:DNA adenine methylase